MTLTQDPSPTVSRVLPDGRLVELLYDPDARQTALAIGRAEGPITTVPDLVLDTGERLAPYAATNNLIATGCVLLPSAPAEYDDKAALLNALRAYLHRYVDLSPLFAEICAHYALLTWVYDAFNELPYLRFRGDFGTGKTRALLALGSVCYKPFFASGASTVSPIFHVLDAFQGTLVLDEADFRFSDATAGLTKILNNGNVAGLPVLRTMTNRRKEFDPRAFRVFGPKLIAMRDRFSDAALESRFLTEETGLRPLRADVPIELPKTLAEDALHLRNQLLTWRFRMRDAVRIDPARAVAEVEPRLNQMALPLLSLIDDPAVRAEVHDDLRRDSARLRQARGDSLEGAMVQALLQVLRTTDCPSITAIASAFTLAAGDRLTRPATPKWVGWFLRERLRLTTVKSGGLYILAHPEVPKVRALATRFGLPPEDLPA